MPGPTTPSPPPCASSWRHKLLGGFRTGPAGDMLTIYTAGYSPAAAIGVCAGDVDLSVFKGKPATLDPIAGHELGRFGPGG